jgi:SAM-dependent methyltransferase
MFPETPESLRKLAEDFQADLSHLKEQTVIPDYGWYPYDSMGALPVLAEMFEPVYAELAQSVTSLPVVDIGCGDGDLAMFFARLGCQVDAVDHAETNFNQLRGAQTLRKILCLPVDIHDLDLNGFFKLPRTYYGLALLLGVLYHLKNPFYVLESVANCADWCVLSTRIAQVTPHRRTRMDDEPLAYLPGSREINNDPTNFWIFSAQGLLRLVERTGWMVIKWRRLGCTVDSDPVRPDADERMLMLLKSRIRYPELHVHPVEGWHKPENDAYCWTAKRFTLDVVLPSNEPAREFALRFFVPETVLASGPVRIDCRIAGWLAGSMHCLTPDITEFRGKFPAQVAPGETLRLEFTVESRFQPETDIRELGICIPLLDPSERFFHRIPLRIS